MKFTELLTTEQVEQVHKASLEILENVGMLVRNPKAREVFSKHGCHVDSGTGLVKFPRTVVEHFRAAFPPKFTFYARAPQYDCTIPDDRPVILTGSSAPNIIDPVTGRERRARSDDIARTAHLINELPGYDVFSISTLADDAPPGQFSLSRFYPALKNCAKPVRGNTPNLDDANQILRLGALIAGGEEAYRARPFITHHYCPCVSPLTMDLDSTSQLIFFSEQQLPSYASIVPNAGLTSPLTLVGTLAQLNAEFLAYGVLTQMLCPGKPLIYSSLPVVTDMRTGAYAPGAIETGVLHMGCAQMARFYNVPNGGYIGLTNAKVNDAQSGYETGMSTVAGLLGGVDIFNMGGLFDALMTFDFAKAVIDNEIGLMLKRIVRGFEFSAENLALDVIAEVGPGEMFAATQHTLDQMKTCALLPEIADRDMRQQWEEKGALDAHAHAMKRVREILTRDNPAVFSPEVDAQIRAAFEGLVDGDSMPPPEWKREAEAEPPMERQRKQRRQRRRDRKNQ
ncbi:MAG: trimethylamine methyltransferase family protein [Anaerolineae bacterium]